MKEYSEFPDLAEVYLEDGYVLELGEAEGSMTFALEVVLTPRHPRCKHPVPGEQYCYA